MQCALRLSSPCLLGLSGGSAQRTYILSDTGIVYSVQVLSHAIGRGRALCATLRVVPSGGGLLFALSAASIMLAPPQALADVCDDVCQFLHSLASPVAEGQPRVHKVTLHVNFKGAHLMAGVVVALHREAASKLFVQRVAECGCDFGVTSSPSDLDAHAELARLHFRVAAHRPMQVFRQLLGQSEHRRRRLRSHVVAIPPSNVTSNFEIDCLRRRTMSERKRGGEPMPPGGSSLRPVKRT